MNTTEVDALFARTLVGEYDNEDAWEAVSALHRNGNREIFERAAAWCVSDDPIKRARGAAISSQLFRPPAPDVDWNPDNVERLFREEAYSLVTKMLENEQDPLALGSAIKALGHLYNAGAIPLILRYQHHPDADVRFQVAVALGSMPDDPQSVVGLTKLALDADEDVRDWAVFGLGVQGEFDSPEIRETLLRCLEDPNKNVREEAALGLGKRQDQRVLPTLLAWVDKADFSIRVAEAAAALMGLERDPPEWTAEDFKPALKEKFQIPD
jgi:HEAT repeat protein